MLPVKGEEMHVLSLHLFFEEKWQRLRVRRLTVHRAYRRDEADEKTSTIVDPGGMMRQTHPFLYLRCRAPVSFESPAIQCRHWLKKFHFIPVLAFLSFTALNTCFCFLSS